MRTKELDQYIGRNVRLALWDAHMTQRQLAERLQVDETIVSKMLRGRRSWSIWELVQTADAVDVPVVELLPEEMRHSLTAGDMRQGSLTGSSGTEVTYLHAYRTQHDIQMARIRTLRRKSHLRETG